MYWAHIKSLDRLIDNVDQHIKAPIPQCGGRISTYPPSNTVMLTALRCNKRDMLHATECMTWQETRRPTERSPAPAQAPGA